MPYVVAASPVSNPGSPPVGLPVAPTCQVQSSALSALEETVPPGGLERRYGREKGTGARTAQRFFIGREVRM
jgi:hypothetical protein